MPLINKRIDMKKYLNKLPYINPEYSQGNFEIAARALDNDLYDFLVQQNIIV